jgi:hypothetical protein
MLSLATSRSKKPSAQPPDQNIRLGFAETAGRRSLFFACAISRLSASGPGRVKTPAPAARVEYLAGFAHHESQIMLRSCSSNPCWRIVFSTSRRCMSFHTDWAHFVSSSQRSGMSAVRAEPDARSRRPPPPHLAPKRSLRWLSILHCIKDSALTRPMLWRRGGARLHPGRGNKPRSGPISSPVRVRTAGERDEPVAKRRSTRSPAARRNA